VLITGPSHGTIGGQAALDLAFGSPEHIILAGRSLEKIQPVIDKLGTDFSSVTVTFIKLDLADLSSVKAAAEAVTSKVDRIDVLINNAGGKVFQKIHGSYLVANVFSHGSQRLY